jgi:hypothetical protein
LIALAAPGDYSSQVNQLILAKQLIEHGANVNGVVIPHGSTTPLHRACFGGVVTNLDLIELLLVKGADPNAQDLLGVTPLMCTISLAPGAARFLLSWPTTNFNITNRSGGNFLSAVKEAVQYMSDQTALLDNPSHVQHQLLLEQWREVEEILVEKGGALIPGSQRLIGHRHTYLIRRKHFN